MRRLDSAATRAAGPVPASSAFKQVLRFIGTSFESIIHELLTGCVRAARDTEENRQPEPDQQHAHNEGPRTGCPSRRNFVSTGLVCPLHTSMPLSSETAAARL